MHSHLRFAQPRRSRNFAQLVFALCVSSSLIASSVFTHALASDSASAAESSNASPSPTLRFEMHTASASSVVPIRLNGRDARWQLVVSLFAPNADPVDVTEQVAYHVEPPQLASVSSDGLVTPLANGTGMITATLEGAELAAEAIEVVTSTSNSRSISRIKSCRSLRNSAAMEVAVMERWLAKTDSSFHF